MPTYLRYGKIKGAVTDPPPYRGWIEVQSVQVGKRHPFQTASGHRESSAPTVTEMVVTKLQDSASPLLFQEATSGQGVLAIIDFVQDGHVNVRYTLKGTVISSYSLSGHGDNPSESLALNFAGIEIEQTPSGPPPPP